MQGQERGPRTYIARRITPYRRNWWEGLPAAAVDIFPWGSASADDFRPVTKAWMAYNDSHLFVFMKSSETDLRTEIEGFSKIVFTDSCMEFFLAPDPDYLGCYYNWEFNPKGAMCLGLGSCREGRDDISSEKDTYRETFHVQPRVETDGWSVEFRLPLEFMTRGAFPNLKFKSGQVMRGNFYKCGDKTSRPHYGCWSPIELPGPDFHCMQFFGELVLE